MFSVFASTPFDTLIDEATSEMLPGAQEDLAKNLEICDAIKGRSVTPATATRALRRRLSHYNPNVQLLSLRLTDACVKNCGRPMLRELASRDFVDSILEMLGKPGTNAIVRQTAADLFQQWAIVFGQYPDLCFMKDAYEMFRREHPDVEFPMVPADLAIDLVTETREPPEWTDNEQCERCRAIFTVTNRKHHCRACGKTFCGACSSRCKAIGEFGYNQPVRVCDACFYLEEYLLFIYLFRIPNGEKSNDIKHDDFALAIQLSLQEKEKEDNDRQKIADEDLKRAIAASKLEHSQQAPKKPKVLSAVERENIHLFSRLLEKGGSGLKGDLEIDRMAREMRIVKLRIEEALLLPIDRTDKADLTRLKGLLDNALIMYDTAESRPSQKDTEQDKIKDLLQL